MATSKAGSFKSDLSRMMRDWSLRRLPARPQVHLTNRNIYILPTPLGCLLAATSAAVWLGALNYTVSLAYALAFWIVGLLLVSAVLAWRQLLDLTLSSGELKAVFAGESAEVSINVQASRGVRRRINLEYCQPDAEPFELVMAAKDDHYECPLPLLMRRRGRWPLPALRIWSDAPYGLFYAFSYVRVEASVLVYPQPLADPVERRGAFVPDDGDTLVELGDDSFSHLSEYRAGEPMRSIAWKVLAKQGRLVSKRFSGDNVGAMPVFALNDYPADIDLESRLSHLTWRVLRAEHDNQRYILQLPGQQIAPQLQQHEASLSALALFNGGQS